MGDISEMMLDGTLCEACGAFIDEEECGYPRLCAACSQETPPEPPKEKKSKGKIRGKG